jgi:putative ubiquitin-RnfH superfamily antitoxin RatB of RatAB toxin-antitoxin module
MNPITVDVVRSPGPRCVKSERLVLPAGSTVADALKLAEAEIGACTVAVWGRRALPQQTLRDGDRIELLRSLRVDPKEARRLRAHLSAPKAKRPARAGR